MGDGGGGDPAWEAGAAVPVFRLLYCLLPPQPLCSRAEHPLRTYRPSVSQGSGKMAECQRVAGHNTRLPLGGNLPCRAGESQMQFLP